MDLKELNPKLYEAWVAQKKLGPDFFQESTDEDIEAIEAEVKAELPQDYKKFLRKYSSILTNRQIGANYFTMKFQDADVIAMDSTLIPWAQLTLKATRRLGRTMTTDPDIGPRVPAGVVPLTIDNQSTLLIDVRSDHFGTIWYLPEIKRQTFGTDTYNWKDIGFVASSFTEFLRELDTEEALKAKHPTFKVLN
ncbi:SMI1/KNR4 family protein [Ochrobactrum chromiisoli]|uniref:SMI1/KNR4 family protein n=1 Tax=Ochrobactrum chromiisoli TaxID=2993941 RepID=A0ABT3QSF1_9HYPH|nr:SMI1/KNR4 family protein [Ochrobactrum chromiisoli]MCX2698450.1 SMI1/KNR4 family protein [Ochrobactrum chromiisoli]